ncbi:MAG: hypothetical protein FP815_13850 [Desulfobulbaceae bacterium]|nr:hypothetical protein [Desulfobulbaceae bacterium]
MKRKEKLTNGITIRYFDESKKIAGDRWLVKLRCHASIPQQEWMMEALNGDDEQTLFCREQFGGQLFYEAFRERNFIDDGEKDNVLIQLRNCFDDNVLGYLAKEEFVKQLFTTRRSEWEKQYLLQSKSSLLQDVGDDDDPEPVDFSACFL